MNDQGLRVAHVGQMGKHAQCFDEALSRGAIAPDRKAEHGPAAARQKFPGELIICVTGQFRIAHGLDRRVRR